MNAEPQTERDPNVPPGGPGRASGAGGNGSLMRTAPALARFAAAAYWRSARWTVAASARAGARVMRAAASGQPPAEVFRSTRDEILEQARRTLGITEEPELERQQMTPEAIEADREEARKTLRDQGAELLRRSADVNFEEDAHPAYARILEDLAPDEGRILRLLAEQGPQPSVDVRTGWIPLKATSELVASGLNMIGAEAGCRHGDDVPAYLNNLFRLGLIWFSSEPLTDPLRYQVLEAQPVVADAMREGGRTRTVRRSIHLTPFGRQFCELCLPVDTGEFEALGAEPTSGSDVGQPDPGEEGNPPGRVDPSDRAVEPESGPGASDRDQ
jgi:Abortive infection alpha